MSNFDETMKYTRGREETATVEEMLEKVYASLKERGYDPNAQLVGYILSGDPTYVTTHNNARYLIRRYERDEILEEIVGHYLAYLDAKARLK